jgi:hypothetical protein
MAHVCIHGCALRMCVVLLLPVCCCTEYNKPLAAALYFSKELSRHGKGAAAILYFGNMVRCS